MATRRPWRSVAALLAGALVLGWAASRWWLPGWIEGRIVAALAGRGLAPASIRVEAPGLGGITLRALRIGTRPDLEVGEIAVRWSLRSLLRARVESIRVRDVDWRFAVTEDALDLGALAPLLEPGAGDAEGEAGGAPALPFEALALEGFRLAIDTPDGPVQGEAGAVLALTERGVESGAFTLDASDAGAARSVHARVTLDDAAHLDGEVKAHLSAPSEPLLGVASADLSLRIDGRVPEAPRLLSGDVAEGLALAVRLDATAAGPDLGAEVAAELVVDQHEARLRVTPTSFRSPSLVQVEGLTLHGSVLDWTEPLPRLQSLELAVARARLDGVELRDVEALLSANAAGEAVAGRFEASGAFHTESLPPARVSVRGDYRASGEEIRITEPECSMLGIDAGAVGGSWSLVEPASVCVERLEARVARARDGPIEVRAVGLTRETPLELAAADGEHLSATLPRLALALSSDASGDRLTAGGEGGRLGLTRAALEATGLDLALSAERAPEAAPAAKLRIAIASLGDTSDTPRFAPLALAVDAAVDGDVVEYQGTARNVDGAARLGASGRHRLDSQQGTLDLQLDTLRFAEPGLQPTAVLPMLAGMAEHADGRLSARGHLAWGPEGLAPVRVDVEAVALAADTPWLRLAGLDGALRLEDALALSTGPRQRLVARRLDPGLPFEDVSLGFTFDAARLDVHELAASVAGGRLRASGAFDSEALAGQVTVNVTDIDLVRLLEEEPVDGLESTGRLTGEIRAEVDPGGTPKLLTGHLVAKAPGGVLRYRPETPPPELALAGEGGAETLRVLRHVVYEKLEIELDGDAEGIRVRFDLWGANPEVQGGRPIQFQLNLNSNYAELVRVLRLTQHFQERRREATGRERPTMVPPS